MAETRAERDQREAEAYLDRAFQFLVDDYGYAGIGRIPVATPTVVVRGYVNPHAGVQVELSGDPPGVTFLGGLRRLHDGEPASYEDGFVGFSDIALVRRGKHDDLLSHNLNPDGWHGVVDAAVRLLKDNRLHFAFLQEHGYRLVYDTSVLTPHEYLVTKELRYDSGRDVVRIQSIDFREGEWAVDRNGRQIGGVFHAAPEEIESIVSLVAAEFP